MLTDIERLERQVALAVLGRKFVAFNVLYLEDGGGRAALLNMAALARVAMMLADIGESTAVARSAFEPFVQRVGDLEDAERNGARSTRYDRVEDAMNEARRRAVAEFEKYR